MKILLYLLAFAFPAFTVSIGLYYLIAKPKPENKYLGYRSERSMISQTIWKRAQFLFGKQLLIGGLVAAFFGYGMVTVTNLLLKILLFLIEFISVAFFGMFTEFILRRELGK